MSDTPVVPVNPPQAIPPVAVPGDDRTVVPLASTFVAQAATTPVAVQQQSAAPASAKEKGAFGAGETVPFVEMNTSQSGVENEPLPPEVESWMEKVSHSVDVADAKNIVLSQPKAQAVSATPPAQTVFVVPLGEDEFKMGLHASVKDSVRWLAVWCQRIIKKFGNTSAFQSQ